MEDLLYFLGVLLAGGVIGWNLREAIARRRIERVMDELESRTDVVMQNIMNVTCEFHDDGSIFIYDRANGAYLGHAENAEKLETMMMEKFPGKLFNVSPEDLKKLELK